MISVGIMCAHVRLCCACADQEGQTEEEIKYDGAQTIKQGPIDKDTLVRAFSF